MCRIAVDDFGTGYSSLAYLQQFPSTASRSTALSPTRSPPHPSLRPSIRTLVQLGKDLGLKTLAEGVEPPSELDHLRSSTSTKAQGFLLSRPLSADTF